MLGAWIALSVSMMSGAAAQDGAPVLGGGAMGATYGDCLTPAQRESMEEAAERFVSSPAYPAYVAPDGQGLGRFVFNPQAGRLLRDLVFTNFVDLHTGSGFLNTWTCAPFTYDGHNGIDIAIRTFAEQGPSGSAQGMPVFAALDGVVIVSQDGFPDMNTSCTGNPNYVGIDHGGGMRTYYLHLKRGSVSVSLGQQVRSGQQIGLIGSSGCSTGPHLHLETHVNGVRREPYCGPCNPGPGLWLDQPDIPTGLIVMDAGLSQQSFAGFAHPSPFPRTGQIALNDPSVTLWMLLQNLPASSTSRTRLVRPNGTTAAQSSVFNLQNPQYPFAWYYAGWSVSTLGGMTGTWRFQWEVNSVLVADLPFEVVPTRDPGFNRAPADVTAAIWPAQPEPEQAVACVIDTDLVYDDPDYDVVRYEYVWTRDGVDGPTEIRRITSYAHSDMIPAGVLSVGDTVRCVVTPSDGTLSAAGASAEASVVSPCPGDSDGNRVVNFLDLNRVLSDFGRGVCADRLDGDVNRDGFVNFLDLNVLLSFFGAGC